VSVEQRLRKSSNVSRRRPKFGTLQMREALLPGLESKSDAVVKSLDEALDRLGSRWGSGP